MQSKSYSKSKVNNFTSPKIAEEMMRQESEVHNAAPQMTQSHQNPTTLLQQAAAFDQIMSARTKARTVLLDERRETAKFKASIAPESARVHA